MRVLLLLIISIGGVFAQGAPSPPTILYGTVRTAEGSVIDDGFTSIVLFADGAEVARDFLVQHPERNENYRLTLANTSGVPDERMFSVKLERDGVLSGIVETTSGVFTFQPSPGGLHRYDFIEGNDANMNGLPDGWEAIYGGNLDPHADPDFDGLTTREEFFAGTNPIDFASRINFSVIRELEDGDIEVAFDAVDGRQYHLQGSPTLVDWVTLVEHTASTSERVTLTVSPTGFYRVRIF